LFHVEHDLGMENREQKFFCYISFLSAKNDIEKETMAAHAKGRVLSLFGKQHLILNTHC